VKKGEKKMYKVSYLLGGGSLRFKGFENLTEATKFANQQPIDSVLEIKYYDTTDNKKPERN
jgi:hypothetical protein